MDDVSFLEFRETNAHIYCNRRFAVMQTRLRKLHYCRCRVQYTANPTLTTTHPTIKRSYYQNFVKKISIPTTTKLH